MIDSREKSRHQGRPVRLYLFKGVEPSLEVLARSVTIIPGTTEFGYGTTPVTRVESGEYLNRVSTQPLTDFKHSIEDLLVSAPNLKHVSLVVSWHGTDLRIGNCQIIPKVENVTMTTAPFSWQVGPVTRGAAQVVSYLADKPAIGGAPSDRTIYEAITFLKSKGLQVTVYPLIMMDVPHGNTLPNPYGGSGQPTYPWRGRITCYPAPGQNGTVDKTAAAATQVGAFFGTVSAGHFSWNAGQQRVNYSGPSDEWSMRRFILHMATIADAAGADDFLIGSELVGITRIRSDASTFPGVNHLISLLGQVRSKLGSTPKISYAADWSEYHSYRPDDGSNDILFPLDPLWANANIDYVGIDNYLPLGDWRDGNHLDRDAGYTSQYEKDYIQKNVEGGEYYDWYYASATHRLNQIRTPIFDGAHGEDWIFRQKDIRGWWSSRHRPRLNGVRQTLSTAWVPSSKQIVFTELGVPAVDKGINQPNVFVDYKSSESLYPYYSNRRPDAAIQRVALEAALDYWKKHGGSMVNFDRISLWTWDARPYPTFPERFDFFGDAGNWQLGHWLTGRLRPGFGFDAGEFGPYAFCDGEVPITRAGITYQPFPVSISDITSNGNLDKSDITVTLARGSLFENEFIGFPVSHVVNLIVFQGHTNDAPTLYDYPAIWVGRVGAPAFENETIAFNCVPVSTSIQRPGLRRNYQLSCPHVLFGQQCRASRNAATVTRTVTAISGSSVTFNTPLPLAASKYRGGLLEWTSDGHSSIRTIVSVTEVKTGIGMRGNLRGLMVGSTIKVTFGCNRLQSDCRNLHQNILNFGGQSSIPLENPLSQKNIFY